MNRSNSIDHLMDELKILCDLYTKPGQQRDKTKKSTFSLEWQFYAGRSIRAVTTEKTRRILNTSTLYLGRNFSRLPLSFADA